MAEDGVAVVRAAVAAAIVCAAAPAAAVQPGAIAPASRASVTITASVAGQARVTTGGAGLCLWSNTATRLVALRTVAPDGTTRVLTARGAGCGADARSAAATLLAAADSGRTILVSPE